MCTLPLESLNLSVWTRRRGAARVAVACRLDMMLFRSAPSTFTAGRSMSCSVPSGVPQMDTVVPSDWKGILTNAFGPGREVHLLALQHDRGIDVTVYGTMSPTRQSLMQLVGANAGPVPRRSWSELFQM